MSETTNEALLKIKEEARMVASELVTVSGISKGDILVVGCSSSEVTGKKIGTFSSLEVAEAVFEGIYEVTSKEKIFLATQCCEHLNRAIIVERKAAKKCGISEVNVIPQPKAGGSFATTAYARFKHPVAVEYIKADAGIDIGDTLIGMHLKSVAVPVRLSVNSIGEAHVVCARTRAKFVGGERAVYNQELL